MSVFGPISSDTAVKFWRVCCTECQIKAGGDRADAPPPTCRLTLVLRATLLAADEAQGILL